MSQIELVTETPIDPESISAPRGPLTLEFFESLPPGTVIRLYYWCVNRGDSLWKILGVRDDRVLCQMEDDRKDPVVWSEPGTYLYDFMGYVSRGSGAEPVHAYEPTQADI